MTRMFFLVLTEREQQLLVIQRRIHLSETGSKVPLVQYGNTEVVVNEVPSKSPAGKQHQSDGEPNDLSGKVLQKKQPCEGEYECRADTNQDDPPMPDKVLEDHLSDVSSVEVFG